MKGTANAKKNIPDVLWHGGKALLCIFQLRVLYQVALRAVDDLLFELLEIKTIGYASIPAIVVAISFLALWWYYDHIDDFSFNRFCDSFGNGEPPPKLLQNPGFLTEYTLTVLGATPILTISLLAPLSFTALLLWQRMSIAIFVSLLFVASISLYRIHRLGQTWAAQKPLRDPKEKPHRPIGRIIYALIYLGSLALFFYCGISIFMPILGTLFKALFVLLRIPFLILLGFLVFFEIIRYVRRIFERKRFLRRLENLRDQGELSFSIHGHPYLSLFGCFAHFGLTVTHRPKFTSKSATDTVYRVSVANCHRRRLTVVLCDNHIFQFMYTINIRIVRAMRGGLGHMTASGVSTARSMALPTFSWFISHTFDFPEGEGERILLVDPAPYVLAIHGQRAGELQPLDNASHVYDYTVYGKNSFVNLLERL